VFKVDDLGRRPLLIGGVSGIVSNFALFYVLCKLYDLEQKAPSSLLTTYLTPTRHRYSTIDYEHKSTIMT
jgi:hypothetical protein